MSQNNLMSKTKYSFKYCLVGLQAAGKSSILKRYANNIFTQKYQSTIGFDIDIISKNIKSLNQQEVKLTIWDTAGQQRFSSIIRGHYKGSDAIFLVYDITDKQSFKSATQFYYNQINNQINIEDRLLVLVANKLDFIEFAQNNGFGKKINGLAKAQQLKMMYYETSAKTAQNINKMFEEVTQKLLNQKKQKNKDKTENKKVQIQKPIKISKQPTNEKENKNKSCSC